MLLFYWMDRLDRKLLKEDRVWVLFGDSNDPKVSLNGIYWSVSSASSTNFIRNVYMFDIYERGYKLVCAYGVCN